MGHIVVSIRVNGSFLEAMTRFYSQWINDSGQ